MLIFFIFDSKTGGDISKVYNVRIIGLSLIPWYAF